MNDVNFLFQFNNNKKQFALTFYRMEKETDFNYDQLKW